MVEHNQSKYYKVPYPTTNTGTYDNKWKFNGKELDDATGMYYYGARYYDPRISIFVSVDPLAEQFAGWTPYHYVHNNPINLIDPTGMAADGWIEQNKASQTPKGYSYVGQRDNSIIKDMGWNLKGTAVTTKTIGY